MSTPKSTIPHYQADEEHDGQDVANQEWIIHPEPDQPDTGSQAGSGVVNFADGRPRDPEGGDAPSGNTA